MLNTTEEIRKIAKMRRDAISKEKRRAEEERERRLKATETALRTIGEAYRILAEGCDEQDRDISLHFRRFWGYGDVRIYIYGSPYRCQIAFECDENAFVGAFHVCTYREDGTIDVSETAKRISEGKHVLEHSPGDTSEEIAESIVANPDEFVTAVLMNIEHRYGHRYGER